MKRRDVLLCFVGVGSVGGVISAQTRPALSPAAVEELMRAHGLDPQPGEPAQVRALLLSTRLSSIPDPRIEPAIRLDPELD
ncbi:MAG: hypothetical protein BMS9Abin37_1332 [Acidobacteriota bacterium]|nr:MAG: hypothetical protein BMS9Abin37_1332 [Acidobacteriota bacterium]